MIGDNVHFIYKHGIFNDFITDIEKIFYEYVDRDMIGLQPMLNVNYSKSYLYFAMTKEGVNVYAFHQHGPSVIC